MLKAENEQGNVRESKNPQLKRHISQINERGLKILVDDFNKCDKSKTTINKHLLNKKTISFRKEDIYKLLNKDIRSLIVEYNQTYPKGILVDRRIIMRDNEVVQTDKGEQNLCIVFSLSKNEVITAYYNPQNDNHTTINMDRYYKYPINGI